MGRGAASSSGPNVGGVRRDGPSKRLRNQLNKASSEWGSLEKQADREENNADIRAIVEELKRDPRKIRPCKRATLSAFFLQQSGSNKFPDYQYLHKTPQEHSKLFLEDLNPKLSAEVVKEMRRHDRHIVPKMLYFALMQDPSDAFGPLNKFAWNQARKARAESLGNPILALEWDADFKVDWEKNGWFDMATKDPRDPGSTRFTHLRFRKNIEVAAPLNPFPHGENR